MEPELTLNDERLPSPRAAEAHDLVRAQPSLVKALLNEARKAIRNGAKKINTDFIRYALSGLLGIAVSHDHTGWLLRALWLRGDAKLRAKLPPHAKHTDAFRGFPL